MKIDRFLAGILAGIGLLIVVALVLFFARQSRVEYSDETTPAGVLHNYVVALHNGDYQRAYAYLAEAEAKPSLAAFQQAFLSNQLNLSDVSLKIDETKLQGNQAYVSITLVHAGSGLFNDSYRDVQNATLEQQSGKWKIRSLPNPYFNWDWYQPTPVK
jgi:hypothetical protein